MTIVAVISVVRVSAAMVVTVIVAVVVIVVVVVAVSFVEEDIVVARSPLLLGSLGAAMMAVVAVAVAMIVLGRERDPNQHTVQASNVRYEGDRTS